MKRCFRVSTWWITEERALRFVGHWLLARPGAAVLQKQIHESAEPLTKSLSPLAADRAADNRSGVALRTDKTESTAAAG